MEKIQYNIAQEPQNRHGPSELALISKKGMREMTLGASSAPNLYKKLQLYIVGQATVWFKGGV